MMHTTESFHEAICLSLLYIGWKGLFTVYPISLCLQFVIPASMTKSIGVCAYKILSEVYMLAVNDNHSVMYGPDRVFSKMFVEIDVLFTL